MLTRRVAMMEMTAVEWYRWSLAALIKFGWWLFSPWNCPIVSISASVHRPAWAVSCQGWTYSPFLETILADFPSLDKWQCLISQACFFADVYFWSISMAPDVCWHGLIFLFASAGSMSLQLICIGKSWELVTDSDFWAQICLYGNPDCLWAPYLEITTIAIEIKK